ncbi:hypothetical protein CRG98_012502 [Punica granatum]|uniref:Retrotransposon gag domain-containing protein n=1 Tax=Punica granatum TaxID=22663 RepID=A0A2I0KEY9_PUNGR|nr:hypothetical protein CRG98_012502 [Punica granatum]
MCNPLVLAWIFNRLEKEVQPSVAYATEAKTLWDDLKERYSQGNEMRIYQLKSDISLYRQEGRTIQKYNSGIKTLWDKLENYLESPGCSRDAAVRQKQQREREEIRKPWKTGDTNSMEGIWTRCRAVEWRPTDSSQRCTQAHGSKKCNKQPLGTV